MKSIFYISLTASAKLIGAGLATIGVVGAGAGIGIVFAGYYLLQLEILWKKDAYSIRIIRICFMWGYGIISYYDGFFNSI